MPTDVDASFWHQWTAQPGDSGVLHVAVLGKSNATVAVPSQLQEASADAVPAYYLPERDKPASALRLRDYQSEAVDAIRDSWGRGVKAPLIVIATGGGKTIIAAEVMSLAYDASASRSLFLAHRRELLDQTAEKIRIVSPRSRVGIVQGTRNELGRDITVASIQTLGHRSKKRLQALLDNGPYDILVCDEAHHSVSDQWEGVISALREQNPEMVLLGMTATPTRADGTALDSVFDEIVYQKNIFDLIDLGYLVPLNGFKVTLDLDLDKLKTRDGDFVKKQLSKLMNTAHVNRAIVQAWCEYGLDRKTIIFAVDVAHALALTEEFKAAGYAADHVNGAMKVRERKAALKRFRDGETKLLTNVEVLTEGYDDPSIEAVLFARPTQSHSLYVQAVGRGLRLYPGKTECLLLDCVGNTDKHEVVQLATLTGYDPLDAIGDERGRGDGEDDGDHDDDVSVLGADIHGEEVELTRRPKKTRYEWRQTSLGWVLQIPRIGYYLVAWTNKGKTKCVIRFYDQRPGRRDTPPQEVLADSVDFDLAYGLVEAEMDRLFNARNRRDFRGHDDGDHGDRPPTLSFIDLDEGTDEDTEVPEEWMLRDGKWRERPASAKQLALLTKYGVKEASLPTQMGEASDLITIMHFERDAKMRLPATPKQIAYIQINGLPMVKTKGAAARTIWQHRKKMEARGPELFDR
jgi:superfamily II DNA or RNA helicase